MTELISAIEKQIGKDRRLAEASVRWAEEKERMTREEMKMQEDRRIKELQDELEREQRERNEKEEVEVEQAPEEVSVNPNVKTRRPSRFAVSSVADKTEAETVSTSDLLLLSPTNITTSTADKAMA